MAKWALVLAVAAAGLSGFVAWDRWGGCSSCRGHADGDVRPAPDADSRLAALEARLKALEARPDQADVPSRPAGATDRATLAGGGAPAGATDEPASTAAAGLEKRLAALEEYRSKAEEDAKRAPAWARSMRLGGRGNLYASVDDAKEDLGLSARQQADFERVVADAKRELDDLRRTPDEDGKTWEQVQKDMFSGLTDGSGKFDFSKVIGYRNKTVPGRNETYGEAERRVRDSAKSRMRETLTPDQQTKFDKAIVEPMIGQGPGIALPGSVSLFGAPAEAGMSGGR